MDITKEEFEAQIKEATKYSALSNKERLDIYNTGAFNRITEGYMIYVLWDLGLVDRVPAAIESLYYAHDMINPLIMYDKWIQGKL